MDIFKVIKENWSEDRPEGRFEHTACIYMDKMYIFGGVDSYGELLSDIWQFDLIKLTWKELKTNTIGPKKGHQLKCVQKGKFIYVFLVTDGSDVDDDDYIYLQCELFRFSLETTEWEELDSFEGFGINFGYHFTMDSYKNYLVFFGGRNGESEVNIIGDLNLYNTETNTWEERMSHAIKRSGHTSVIYKDKLYVFGGSCRSNIDGKDNFVEKSNDLIEYDFKSDSWKDCLYFGNAPPARSDFDQSAVVRDSMYVFGSLEGDPNLYEYNFLENRWYTYSREGYFWMDTHTMLAYHDSLILFGGCWFFSDHYSYARHSLAIDSILSFDVGKPRRTLFNFFNPFFEKKTDLTIIQKKE